MPTLEDSLGEAHRLSRPIGIIFTEVGGPDATAIQNVRRLWSVLDVTIFHIDILVRSTSFGTAFIQCAEALNELIGEGYPELADIIKVNEIYRELIASAFLTNRTAVPPSVTGISVSSAQVEQKSDPEESDGTEPDFTEGSLEELRRLMRERDRIPPMDPIGDRDGDGDGDGVIPDGIGGPLPAPRHGMDEDAEGFDRIFRGTYPESGDVEVDIGARRCGIDDSSEGVSVPGTLGPLGILAAVNTFITSEFGLKRFEDPAAVLRSGNGPSALAVLAEAVREQMTAGPVPERTITSGTPLPRIPRVPRESLDVEKTVHRPRSELPGDAAVSASPAAIPGTPEPTAADGADDTDSTTRKKPATAGYERDEKTRALLLTESAAEAGSVDKNRAGGIVERKDGYVPCNNAMTLLARTAEESGCLGMPPGIVDVFRGPAELAAQAQRMVRENIRDRHNPASALCGPLMDGARLPVDLLQGIVDTRTDADIFPVTGVPIDMMGYRGVEKAGDTVPLRRTGEEIKSGADLQKIGVLPSISGNIENEFDPFPPRIIETRSPEFHPVDVSGPEKADETYAPEDEPERLRFGAGADHEKAAAGADPLSSIPDDEEDLPFLIPVTYPSRQRMNTPLKEVLDRLAPAVELIERSGLVTRGVRYTGNDTDTASSNAAKRRFEDMEFPEKTFGPHGISLDEMQVRGRAPAEGTDPSSKLLIPPSREAGASLSSVKGFSIPPNTATEAGNGMTAQWLDTGDRAAGPKKTEHILQNDREILEMLQAAVEPAGSGKKIRPAPPVSAVGGRASTIDTEWERERKREKKPHADLKAAVRPDRPDASRNVPDIVSPGSIAGPLGMLNRYARTSLHPSARSWGVSFIAGMQDELHSRNDASPLGGKNRMGTDAAPIIPFTGSVSNVTPISDLLRTTVEGSRPWSSRMAMKQLGEARARALGPIREMRPGPAGSVLRSIRPPVVHGSILGGISVPAIHAEDGPFWNDTIKNIEPLSSPGTQRNTGEYASIPPTDEPPGVRLTGIASARSSQVLTSPKLGDIPGHPTETITPLPSDIALRESLEVLRKLKSEDITTSELKRRNEIVVGTEEKRPDAVPDRDPESHEDDMFEAVERMLAKEAKRYGLVFR